MAVPDPANVAPWYLRNITQALQLDETTGNVFMRTGIQGNVYITGPVTIPGTVTVDSTAENPVHVHLDEVGTSGILNVPYLPVSVVGAIEGIASVVSVVGSVTGNVNVNNFPAIQSITGNVNASVTGNVGIVGNVNVTQGTNPWSITGNVQIANAATDLTIADSTYEMNVARGLVDGQYQELKNGFATGINQNDEVTIWNNTTLYPWSSWPVAQKLYIISTSASDTGQTLRIEGLDASYNKITENVTTNGLTAVATTQNFLRLNRAYLVAGNTNVGTITERLTSGTGTVVGSMAIGFCRNKGGFFTVPNGYTAYIQYGDATQFRGGSGNIGGVIKMYTRTGAGPFLLQIIAEVVNGLYRNDFPVPLAIPQQTDIDVRIIADGNGTQATCSWQMILIPN